MQVGAKFAKTMYLQGSCANLIEMLTLTILVFPTVSIALAFDHCRKLQTLTYNCHGGWVEGPPYIVGSWTCG